MQIKAEKITKVIKFMFGAMLLGVITFFFFGELFGLTENPTEDGDCVLLEADWERVFSDGTRQSVELPGQCDVKRGEIVRIETSLPKTQEDTWFCMRASQQDMRIYVEDELRKEYCTEETRLFGRNSASAFVFFKIKEEDAGKGLAIELVSDSEYNGFLNEIYVGDKFDIVRTFVKQCAVVLFVSFYMLILSSITVLVGCVLRLVHKIKIDITYLGLGILQLSLAMLAESRIRQFFLPNSSVAEHVGFLLTMLIPYPFMVYVNRIQKGRYQKSYKVLSWCVAVNIAVSILLQMFNVLDFADSMIVSYGLIILMVLVIAVTICMDIKKGKIREYGEVAFGMIAMLVVTLWEIYLTFVPQSPYFGGVALSFGLIILLFMAGFKTARDMLASEQKKQMAIAAGEAKEKFLANMSHEIRTPINTIIGMNEMILRENQGGAVEEYAKSVQNASRLLLGIINDILDFSKIEAGKVDILEMDYHLSEILTDVIKGIQIKADSKKLWLRLDVEESLPSVLRGDEIRIRQVLNNLLSNAVKYTEQGTITFTVRGIYAPEGFALGISVEDTGIGIKPEDLDKLFDSFQRLEEQKNRYIEGTGLGLNITKQLVELMHGSIEVRSEYGKGSCFTVKIPQQIIDETAIGGLEAAYQRDTSAKEEDGTRLYAPTADILVVDDNEMNLAVAKALLKRTGIRLTMAQSGTECLALCRKYKYDLILMDHMMPEPDGIETLHLLREDKLSLNQNTGAIVLTANAIAGMAEKYIEEGFLAYVSKPIAAEELEEAISRHLPEEKREKRAIVNEANSSLEKPKEGTSVVFWAEKNDKDDICYIDPALGLQYCSNSEEFYREMLETYRTQGQKYLKELSEYGQARNWKKYKVIVHSLKSTSLMIGAAAFSERAKSMESAAKEEKEEVLLLEHEIFMGEYKKILDKIPKAEAI